MKPIQKSATMLFSLAAILTSSSAFALSTAEAKIDKLGYQLIDLDLADSIAPSIMFSNIYSSSSTSITNGIYPETSSIISSLQSATFKQLETSGVLGAAEATSKFSGGVFPASFLSKGKIDGAGNYSTSESFNSTFTLSPHTLLLMTGLMSTTAEKSDIYSYNTNANSYASISLSGNLTPSTSNEYGYYNYGYGNQSSSLSLSSYPQSGGSSQNDQPLSFGLSFLNNNSAGLNGTFNASVSAFGSDNTVVPLTPLANPVPEPETYMMMLSGLALMGVTARRRPHKKVILRT